MIPRKLHRVWVGSKPVDDQYLASWRRHCPGWEIRTWTNEDAERISLPYVREAYAAGKWAFVSDYLRLHALAEEGGVYLDTDVELTAPLDPLCDNRFFVGLTARRFPQTAVIGSERGDALVRELLAGYEKSKFDLGLGVYDEHPINLRFKAALERHGAKFDDIDITVEHEPEPGVRLYPCSLLCAAAEGRPNIAIHHANGTWLDPYKRMNVIPLGFGLRLLRLKRRAFAGDDAPLNLLDDERLRLHASYRRFTFALVSTHNGKRT